ncbi:hypothetical protein RB2150_01369 [Rhodobacteraceae bacterium HTCC2150]|nr:hypothetical protein RB2150_01369 [Rhodobacteraceae bacterium HTCC2150]
MSLFLAIGPYPITVAVIGPTRLKPDGHNQHECQGLAQ